MRILPRLAIGIAVLACGGCSGSFMAGEQSDQIRVSHQRHTKAKIECVACHDKVWDATTLGTPGVLPAQDTCKQCHQKAFDTGNCALCHTDSAKPMTYAKKDWHLHMDHAKHIDRVKEDCAVCHKNLPEPGRSYEPPTMAACLSCHEHQQDFNAGRCDLCHTDLLHYPDNPVSIFSHQANWVRMHPTAARAAPESCSKCHDQTYCAVCHEAQTVPIRVETRFPEHVQGDFQIHRGDWLSRHSLEAQSDETSCKRCHGAPFCNSCHAQQNLTPASLNPRNPHPPGWAFPGPNSHASAARSDIISCQSCHDQGAASNCISCHKVGGIGGDPHPASFLARHNAGQIRQNAMCLYCHQ